MASEQSHQVDSDKSRFFGEASNFFFLSKLVVIIWVSLLHFNDINVFLLDVHVVIVNSEPAAQLQSRETSQLIHVVIKSANLTVSQDEQAVILIVLVGLECINDEL